MQRNYFYFMQNMVTLRKFKKWLNSSNDSTYVYFPKPIHVRGFIRWINTLMNLRKLTIFLFFVIVRTYLSERNFFYYIKKCISLLNYLLVVITVNYKFVLNRSSIFHHRKHCSVIAFHMYDKCVTHKNFYCAHEILEGNTQFGIFLHYNH